MILLLRILISILVAVDLLHLSGDRRDVTICEILRLVAGEAEASVTLPDVLRAVLGLMLFGTLDYGVVRIDVGRLLAACPSTFANYFLGRVLIVVLVTFMLESGGIIVLEWRHKHVIELQLT